MRDSRWNHKFDSMNTSSRELMSEKAISKKAISEKMANKKLENGYVTVYLSLTMAVLLSLCLTMIEGARSNAIILESEIACDVAMNSIMSEYNRELMKQYNIFAIEDSYGGNNASLDNTDAHLSSYLNNNFSEKHFLGAFLNYRDYLGLEVESAQTEGVLYLTDDNGSVFMRRAYEAIKDDIGLTLMSQIAEWTGRIEADGLEHMDVQGNMALLEDKYEETQLSDGEVYEVATTDPNLPAVSQPADFLAGLNCGVMNMVIEDQSDISMKEIDSSELIYSRMRSGNINTGNFHLDDDSFTDGFIERFVFQEYLLRYMGQYKEECKDDALSYQIEYIIAGHNFDRDNLSDVLTRIFAIRFATAYLCIKNDEEKVNIAELLAAVIAIFTYTEELEDVYKELFLMCWAGNEAKYDMKSILEGNRIELVKTEDNWHTSILGYTEDTSDSNYRGDESGLSYTDYLRVFMSLMSTETLVGRAMDMVEANVRNTAGNSKFRMDACIDTIQVFIKVESTFGYRYSFRIKRKYE